MRFALVLAACLGVLASGAAEAPAGTYAVKSCFAGGEFSSKAFVVVPRDLTRGMGLGRACSDASHARIKGIVTADRGEGLRPRGSRAMVKLFAPAGTKITGMAWRGGAERSDCGWEMAVYAADGPRVVRTIQKVPAGLYRSGRPCPREIRPQAVRSNHIRREAFPEGATRIVQRIVCKGHTRRYCSARGANYIRTLASTVTIRDDTPPEVQITGGSLMGGWVSQSRDVQFSARDTVGVERAELVDESGRLAGSSSPRECDFSIPVPCPNGPGTLKVDTRDFAREGTQRIELRGYDTASNVGSASGWVHVDNTPPPRVDPALDGGDGWHRSNGFTARWQNPPELDRAPIVGAHYRVCRGDGKQCSEPQRRQGTGIADLSGLTVPGPGEWNLTMWREDEAGNLREDNASTPVKLRYDPEAPQLAFEAMSPTDPTRVSVLVKEELSGLAAGQISMSREGSGVWQDLPTQREGTGLTARVDDSKFAPGTYVLRAQAADNAGNQASTDRRSDGAQMVLTLPLRVRSMMRSGVLERRLVRRRGGHRRGARRITRLVERARMRMGVVVRLSGSLLSEGGQPLPNQTVYLGGRTEAAPETFLGTTTTDSRGRYSRVVRASRSSTFRFVYLGTPTVLPAQSELELQVPAATSLTASRRRLLNGQSVLFSGALRGSPVPAAGKLVELQVRLSGQWQTFRTVRTDRRGLWRVPYRFRRTTGLQQYVFRARLPREAGYPFEPGRSRRVTVVVRGRGRR